jgi:O-antigen/teichoic acid export membrane protein
MDLAVTTGGTLLTTAAQMVFMRVIAENLGPEEFGAHALARRVVSTLLPAVTLGTGVGIPRFLGGSRTTAERDAFLLAGLALGVGPAVVLAALALPATRELATLLIRRPGYETLVLATLALTLGQAIFAVLYGLYRGEGHMGRANVWQVATAGIGPLITAWIFAKYRRADVLIALSAAWSALAAVPLALSAIDAGRRTDGQSVKARARVLLAYGLPRVPAGFALGALFATGPFLAPHFDSLQAAGHLVAGQSVLTVAESLVVAFGLVALPRFARLAAEGQHEPIRQGVEDTIAFVWHVGLLLAVMGIVWSEEIVVLLLGPQYRPAVPVLEIMLGSLVPYLAYVMLRSIVDAVEDRAVNTRNLTLAVLTAALGGAALASVGLGARGLALGSAAGILVLGAGTVRFLARRYRIDWTELRAVQTSASAALLLLVCVLLRRWLLATYQGTLVFLIAAAASAALGLLYLVFLRWLGVAWLDRILRHVRGISS